MALISESIGKGIEREFAGKTWLITPLDINDLSDLEDYLTEIRPGGTVRSFLDPETGAVRQVHMYGIECLDLTMIKDQRYCLYLALRRADPQLGDADRQRCSYHLTVNDVGRMVTAEMLEDPATAAFINDVLVLSGIMPKPAAEDKQPKKAVAESGSRSRSRSAGASRYSGSDAATVATK